MTTVVSSFLGFRLEQPDSTWSTYAIDDASR